MRVKYMDEEVIIKRAVNILMEKSPTFTLDFTPL